MPGPSFQGSQFFQVGKTLLALFEAKPLDDGVGYFADGLALRAIEMFPEKVAAKFVNRVRYDALLRKPFFGDANENRFAVALRAHSFRPTAF